MAAKEQAMWDVSEDRVMIDMLAEANGHGDVDSWHKKPWTAIGQRLNRTAPSVGVHGRVQTK